MRPARLSAAAGAALLAFLLPACAPADDDSSSSPGSTTAASGAAATCDRPLPGTRTPGTLTVGTDKPAYTPWFVDDDPSNGKGFESAVAYAVADRLGFPKDKVTWVTASFNSVIQPGAKPFDFDINQFSITDERKQAVDFSSGYYDVSQAVVTTKGTKAASAKSIADLRGVKLGAQVGTTSYQTITQVIKPSSSPSVFDDNDKAKLALANGQIDALVVDLPTALYLAAAEIKNGVVVGQLPTTTGQAEQFGLVLEKNSTLTSCVSAAVTSLKSDGTLDKLETEWLTGDAGAPVLK
jgi:polar amino acid transport system substrate-binding protein